MRRISGGNDMKVKMVKDQAFHKSYNLNIQGTLRYLTKTNDKKYDDTLVKFFPVPIIVLKVMTNDALNDKVIADFPPKWRRQ